MRTGLESQSDETLARLITNLKNGALEVVNMGDEAFVTDPNKKECPPVAAFQLNMGLLETFQAEALRRGMDYDSIGPNIREIEEMWIASTE